MVLFVYSQFIDDLYRRLADNQEATFLQIIKASPYLPCPAEELELMETNEQIFEKINSHLSPLVQTTWTLDFKTLSLR